MLSETRCFEQTFFAQPLSIEQARLILRAAVAEDRRNRVAGPESLSQLHGCRDIHPARAAEEQTLVAQELVHGANALDVGHVERVVERRSLQIGGDSTDSNPFGNRSGARGLQLAVPNPMIKRAALRVRTIGL